MRYQISETWHSTCGHNITGFARALIVKILETFVKLAYRLVYMWSTASRGEMEGLLASPL